jgi:hypothetical protein
MGEEKKMILWGRRAAAVLTGVILGILLFPSGSHWGGTAGGVLNLALAMAEKFPSALRRFLPPSALVINTLLSAYGVLVGGSAAWAVLVAGLSFFSWNAGLFGQRWGDAPRPMQLRYLKRIGSLAALGLGTGLSAAAWQGNFSLPFSLAFLSMLAGGVLLLRLMSQMSPKG